MKAQKSFEKENEAVLYLVPTPIGNLDDMTFRTINILKQADLIAAEDTRNTKKLCNHFDIQTPLVSYHEHNMNQSGESLIEKMKSGKQIALVSDAGMPAISDPGYELVQSCIEEDIKVVSLPGANAALTALIASGIVPQPFYFYGFLNRSRKEKKKELERLKIKDSTIIFYESPHRLKETLTIMYEYFGNRKIVLARELTKKFEEYIRGTMSEIIQWANEHEIRGEFVIITEGSDREELDDLGTAWWTEMELKEHVDFYIESENLKPNEAIKKVAKDRGLQKREIYQAYHVEEN
ncbi:16S rRNA (cytidine(1402)-2'-O)-methyltransferase [Pradoshia sp. D12]|uniref:16S rRNA (cytidine(1402)-2'-O)-methyltransferase n=1 Tax=Bacillaceae TaxID=186817 RepID=UPI00080AE4A1|nr:MULTISPECIES: 16S rRNA (cytidine(1402)-2'-O)-methyltransferase [Bacillaceae]OCA88477.1 16S rRNA (cytidine(1402)-2'-O)-methyltransferase [Bacillus sp. FJAT-27986]QFK69826.1 16S rRNA (cytidine(1402)-2'-O)-methyltransferase [Pradoshia sp. D12]